MTSDSETASSNDVALVCQAIAAAYGIDVINVREVVRGVNRTFSLCDSGDRTYYLASTEPMAGAKAILTASCGCLSGSSRMRCWQYRSHIQR